MKMLPKCRFGKDFWQNVNETCVLASLLRKTLIKYKKYKRNVISEASSKKLQLVSKVKDLMISYGFVMNLKMF